MELEKIFRVDLQSSVIRKVLVKAKNSKTNFTVIVDSKNDEQRKIIIVKSLLGICNRTDQKIQIFMMSEIDKESLTIEIPSGKDYQLPIDKLNHIISFRFFNEKQELPFSTYLDINRILNLKQEQNYVLQHSGNQFSCIKIKRNNRYSTNLLIQVSKNQI